MKIPIKIKIKDNKVQQKNSMRGNFPGGGGGGGGVNYRVDIFPGGIFPEGIFCSTNFYQPCLSN